MATKKKEISEPYEINTELVLSTCHIPRNTAEWMEKHKGEAGNPADVLRFHNVEYGYMIWTGGEEEIKQDFVPRHCPWLYKLIKLARSLGCKWLRLDRDGLARNDLRTWEW